MKDEDFLLVSRHMSGGDEGKAFLGLASIYHRGTEDIEKDSTKALHYFKKAGELGEGKGAFNAGAIYDENGNNDLALIWYKKAAACGNDDAMYNLGLMYAEGQGVPQDYSESFYWYEKADRLGHIEATYNMGVMEKTTLNYDGALIKYKKAALAGHDRAAYNAGVLYEQVFEDNKSAFLWYEKAANLGLPEGMFEIGKMYHQGVGVVANHEAAEIWLIKAYNLGNSSAKNYLIQNSG